MRLALLSSALLAASAGAAPPPSHALSASGAIFARAPLAGEAPLTTRAPAPRALGAGAVGATYSIWHAPAVAALARVAAAGGPRLSVEDVIRARGALGLRDVYDRWNVTSEDALYFQNFPAAGPYCLYRARAGEPGLLPDCAGIPATAARHAAALLEAGVDFVAADATNLCTPSDQADAIQTRPLEVLFEEWAALRAAGTPTPAISPWWPLRAGCSLQGAVLRLFNNATTGALLTRDARGRKVWFTPAGADADLVAAVEANGGRNDIVVQEMWANFAFANYSQGTWTFMSPCTAPGAGGALEYTTSVVSPARGASGCGQRTTSNSQFGTSATVAASYQLSYGSVPFASAGRYDGLTLKRQWSTIWEGAAGAWAAAAAAAASAEARGADAGAAARAAVAGAASPLPDNVVLSTFNEWVAQPQANPFHSPFSYSMGLGATRDDRLFVDTFGASLARDLEPSALPGGGAVWDIQRSCVRVLRAAAAAQAALAPELRGGAAARAAEPLSRRLARLGASFGARAPLASCAIAGEACCAYNGTVEAWAPVWSLRAAGGAPAAPPGARAALASADAGEVARLLAPGGAWAEACNPYGGPTDFCVDEALRADARAVAGPFVVRAAGCGAAAAGSGLDPAAALPGRVRVQRCLDARGAHFLSNDAACGGAGAPDAVVGCADAAVSGAMPRSLTACAPAAPGAGAFPFHALDAPCPAGFEGTLLGFVR